MQGKFRYKKHFGQNFLHDTVKISRMAQAMTLSKEDTVIEIGPGAGALTRELVKDAGKVIAVEIDPAAIEKIREKLGSSENLEIVNMDFMDYSFSSKLQIPSSKIKIAGNIPYNITTPIIEKLIDNKQLIDKAYLTVQKEVAERIVAKEGSKTYGSLSVFVQYHADAKLVFKIGKKAFFPVPKVDSAFLCLDFTHGGQVKVKDENTFFRLVRAGFNQRRKMLSNNIKREFGLNAEETEENLKKAGIAVTARAEDVSILNFAKLSDIIYNKSAPNSKFQVPREE